MINNIKNSFKKIIKIEIDKNYYLFYNQKLLKYIIRKKIKYNYFNIKVFFFK